MKNKGKNQLFYISLFLVALSFICSTIISLKTINNVIHQEDENMATLLADKIYGEINTELQSDIVAGKAIANNQDFAKLISDEDKYSYDEMENILKGMLGRYADGLGCNTVFVVSDKSKRYYTQQGFNKTVSPETDDHDIWYSKFLENGREVEFNIDVDETNNRLWTVFVNVRLYDDYGNFLGVCGIGTEMKGMQTLISDIQETYDVKINIIDNQSLVQIGSDDDNIEKVYLEDHNLYGTGKSYQYEKTRDGYTVSKYMDDLGWTLIVQRKLDTVEIMVSLMRKNFLVMIGIFILLMIAATLIIRKESRRMAKNLQLSSYDTLAGVYKGLYLINIKSGQITEIKSVFGDDIKIFDLSKNYYEQVDSVIDGFVLDEFREGMYAFGDLSDISERLADRETIYYEFKGERLGWCRARFIAVKNDDKQKLVNIMFALEVIDKEKRENEALKKETEVAKAASDAKGKFLANMSHEIRTPINAVLGMDTMILRESTEPQIREYAMNIQNAGNTLLSIINDILDFSKIESGKMEIVPVPYDFSSLIYDVVNMVTMKAESKSLAVNLEIDNTLPAQLLGDDVRIRQILLNIMNNAVKYTNEGSVTLCVTGQVDGNEVLLHFSVKDTGIGIKEEDMKKLFEDFERIEESRNRSIEGTGLGMSITKNLLELMGTRLQVDSVYGEGSNFYFDLKQVVRSHEMIGDLSERVKKNAEEYEYASLFVAPDAKILVVDDNATNRMVFTQLIKETEIQVDEAAGGKEALELISNKKYDIIFLDHMMPEMDGTEVLKEIKKDNSHPNEDTPIIVLTANAISGAREEYLDMGFDGYLAKPIIPDKLEKTFAMFLPVEKMKNGERKKKQESLNNAMPDTLPSIEGVDWNYAWLHISNEELLLHAVKSFYYAADMEAAELSSEYDRIIADSNNDDAWDLYRIKVHAMKSAANLLGLVPIGGMAASLEAAARDRKYDYIKDVTPHFLASWVDFKYRLKVMVEDDNSEKKEITDCSHIEEYVTQLVESLNNFDVHSADVAMARLNEYRFEGKAKEILDEIAGAVAGLDVETVEQRGEEMIKLLKA